MTHSTIELAFIIDDNEIDLFVQKRLIEINKFADRVITFSSAFQAVSSLKMAQDSDIPKVIFLDLNMPGMSGFDFLEHFKQFSQSVRSKTKVVVLTSSSNSADKEKAMNFDSVFHFVSKPLTEKTLDQIRDQVMIVSNL